MQDKNLFNNVIDFGEKNVRYWANQFNSKLNCEMPILLLNAKIEDKELFLKLINADKININQYSKKTMAKIQYMINCVKYSNNKNN